MHQCKLRGIILRPQRLYQRVQQNFVFGCGEIQEVLDRQNFPLVPHNCLKIGDTFFSNFYILGQNLDPSFDTKFYYSKFLFTNFLKVSEFLYLAAAQCVIFRAFFELFF